MKSKYGMEKTIIKTVMLIDNNDIDNFINQKILKSYGTEHIHTFNHATDALTYLSETNIRYQLILIENHLSIMDGFEFCENFKKMNLNKRHGKLCLIHSYLSPQEKEKVMAENIPTMVKPLTIEKLNTLSALL